VLYLLKLGGSLITEKTRPHTSRTETLERLALEISAALKEQPGLQLIIGHGSGSFGHVAANKYHTRQGVQSAEQWQGFAEVWQEARALNQIVVEVLCRAGLPIIAFPPSACAMAKEGQVQDWNPRLLQSALEADMVPLINGDVAFDQSWGGTILSTEDLFCYLAPALHAHRILLAGLEAGVWADFPVCTRLIPKITPRTYKQLSHNLGGSTAVDVTGGMFQKVNSMLSLTEKLPNLQALIFSGEKPGQVYQALSGKNLGTLICNDNNY
jgi:isopentenyl phosphate kinase